MLVLGIALHVHLARVPVAVLGLALRPPVRPDAELRVAEPVGRLVLRKGFPGRLEFVFHLVLGNVGLKRCARRLMFEAARKPVLERCDALWNA